MTHKYCIVKKLTLKSAQYELRKLTINKTIANDQIEDNEKHKSRERWKKHNGEVREYRYLR
jgi:hypothetical protein